MAAKKRTEPPGSYTPRDEQQTMPGLPSQAPVVLPLSEQDRRRLELLPPQDRLRQILQRWGVPAARRGPPVPEGQLGLPGVAGLETPANQMDLFDKRPKR